MTARRVSIGLAAGAVAVAAIFWGVHEARARQEADAYLEQLRLARDEGLPATASEYAAFIAPAADAENAAPYYRRLQTAAAIPADVDLGELDRTLCFHPSPETAAEARARLAKFRARLDLVDAASQRPRCWFNRRWEGEATLFRELPDMKSAARLLALRGSLAASEGRVADALADTQRVFQVARHAGEEPHMIAALVRESIYSIGLRDLAAWAFKHRDRPEYVEALKSAVQHFPRFDLKSEHRADLYNVLSTIELCATPEGRARLGLAEEDVAKGAERIFPVLLSQSKSRIEIVKAVRAAWAALDRPARERPALLDKARSDLFSGLLAFPTAAKIYEMLSVGGSQPDRETVWEARHQQDLALAQALETRPIPRTLDTRDLPSPFDGRPLIYVYDGNQIRITVSGWSEGGGPKPLALPPDAIR